MQTKFSTRPTTINTHTSSLNHSLVRKMYIYMHDGVHLAQ